MTPDQIIAAINAVGYPICVSIAMYFINRLLLARYMKASDDLIQTTKEYAINVADHATKTENVAAAANSVATAANHALIENTRATNNLSIVIQRRMEQSTPICRAGELIEEMHRKKEG